MRFILLVDIFQQFISKENLMWKILDITRLILYLSIERASGIHGF